MYSRSIAQTSETGKHVDDIEFTLCVRISKFAIETKVKDPFAFASAY